MLFSEGDRAAKRAKGRRAGARQTTANLGHTAVRRR